MHGTAVQRRVAEGGSRRLAGDVKDALSTVSGGDEMWKLRNFGCSSETAAHINHLDARTYLCLLSLAKCLGRSRRWVAASTGTTIFSPAMVYVCCWRGWRRVVSTCCVCFGDFRPTSFVCPHLSRTTLSLAQQLPLLALHLTSRCGIVEVVVATGVAKGREGERKDGETSDFVLFSRAPLLSLKTAAIPPSRFLSPPVLDFVSCQRSHC